MWDVIRVITAILFGLYLGHLSILARKALQKYLKN